MITDQHACLDPHRLVALPARRCDTSASHRPGAAVSGGRAILPTRDTVLTVVRTRGRGSQSAQDSRTWVPNDLMLEYYAERATPGGLLITEAG